MNKKIGLTISCLALLIMVGMFAGMGVALTGTTKDLGEALAESNEPVKTDTAIAMAERAYSGARATQDPTFVDTGYAEPLGESRTVWADRSKTLAAVATTEVAVIGVLAFIVVFFVSRVIKRMLKE